MGGEACQPAVLEPTAPASPGSPKSMQGIRISCPLENATARDRQQSLKGVMASPVLPSVKPPGNFPEGHSGTGASQVNATSCGHAGHSRTFSHSLCYLLPWVCPLFFNLKDPFPVRVNVLQNGVMSQALCESINVLFKGLSFLCKGESAAFAAARSQLSKHQERGVPAGLPRRLD